MFASKVCKDILLRALHLCFWSSEIYVSLIFNPWFCYILWFSLIKRKYFMNGKSVMNFFLLYICTVFCLICSFIHSFFTGTYFIYETTPCREKRTLMGGCGLFKKEKVDHLYRCVPRDNTAFKYDIACLELIWTDLQKWNLLVSAI